MAAKTSPTIVTGLSLLFVLVSFVKASLAIAHILSTSASDFAFYYHASQSLLPPMSVLVYRPLSLLPFRVAEILWILGSVGALLHSIWMCTKRYGDKSLLGFLVAASIAYLAFPTRFTLGMGQVNLFALWLLLLATQDTAGSIRQGILLGLAILIKPELVLLVVPLAVSRRWKTIGVLMMVGVLSVLVSLWVLGGGTVLGYGATLGGLFRDPSGLAVYYNQGLTGLLARAHIFSIPVYAVLAVSFLLAALSLQKKTGRTLGDAIWLFMPVWVLIEPIAWQHHFVFLIPTYWLLWHRRQSGWYRVTLIASYGLIGWNFAHPSILATIPFGWLILSHAGIGALILVVLSFFV